ERLFSDVNGKILLSRLDPCGDILWSRSYERQGEYLEFIDFAISDEEETFVFGSSFIGLDELIFMLKIDPFGNVIQFRYYEPETVDHFTFSIDLKDGQLMLYGLLLGWDTQKQGLVAVFDEDLVFQWGQKFAPFESVGDAIITSRGSFLCRSGNYLYKLGAGGGLEWSRKRELAPSTKVTSGPMEFAGGYLFESNRFDSSYYFLIDQSGDLLWTSPKFAATNHGSHFSVLDNGHILAAYNRPAEEQTKLCLLELAVDGSILWQRQLEIDLRFDNANLYKTINSEGRINLVANASPFRLYDVDPSDFALQFNLNQPENDCFSWDLFDEQFAHTDFPVYAVFDTTASGSSLREENPGALILGDFSLSSLSHCRDENDQELIQIDTFLACDQDWTVQLPSREYRWEDDYPRPERIIEFSGLYRASNQNCGMRSTYEYRLMRPECGCPVYFPNAFSPNDDGVNDDLVFHSGCQIVEMTMSVYNRWGTKLFEGSGENVQWDGKYQGQPVQIGVYLAVVSYQWTDESGQMQQSISSQDVTLIR
ncbi:MAG: gliding motility-associated C-terminal domain-containing protein, partial [Bacteroidota bacterium]